MPWEFGALKHEPEPLENCPMCGAAFRCFLRGMVHSPWRKLFCLDYVAVICEHCKEIVGYEKPYTFRKRAFPGDHLQGL
jgi:hypothetical protein